METAVQAVNRDRYDDADWWLVLGSVGVILYRQAIWVVDDDVLRFIHYLGYETEEEFCQARGFTDLVDAFYRNGWFEDIRAFTDEIQPDIDPHAAKPFFWDRDTLLRAHPPLQTKCRDRYVQEGEQSRRLVQRWLGD